MPLGPENAKTFERNTKYPRAYESTAIRGGRNYHPEITYYYADASGTELVRVEERIQTADDEIAVFGQTISGSEYSDQWPNYSSTVVYKPWDYSTTSGTL